MNLIQNANPVGTPQTIPQIEEQIKAFCSAWDEDKNKKTLWKLNGTEKLHKVTNFLMSCLDILVCLVDKYIESGPDKKATVLNAICQVYDYVIKEVLPFWLRPFAGWVKNYIIYVLVSQAIDWMVDKYRSGSWQTPKENDGEQKT